MYPPSKTGVLTKYGFMYKDQSNYDEEWLAVKEALTEGMKIKKGSYIDGVTLKHSYIKFLDGVTYALASQKGCDTIGKGGFGNVKYAIDKIGRLYAIKIESYISPMTQHVSNRFRSEDAISYDLSLSQGPGLFITRPGPFMKGKKHYRVSNYLGISLDKILSDFVLTPEEKLDLAIKACIKVYKLHSGNLSKKKEKYIHNDIKLNNFTASDKGNKIHLIDLGLTRAMNDRSLSAGGTTLYLPFPPNLYQGSKDDPLKKQALIELIIKYKNILGKIGCDVFALKRTLYFDPSLPQSLQSIFDALMFKSFPQELQNILNTHKLDFENLQSWKRKDDTALFLAAILIAYKNDHDLDILMAEELLKNNEEIQLNLINTFNSSLEGQSNQNFSFYKFQWAIHEGNRNKISILCSQFLQSPINNHLMQAKLLIDAVKRNLLDILEIFIKAGFDLDARNQNGSFALFEAALDGKKEIVALLLNNKANSNLFNSSKVTSVYAAAQNGHDEIIILLAQAGADLNMKINQAKSPLYIALLNGYLKTFETLLTNGADLKQDLWKFLIENKKERKINLVQLFNMLQQDDLVDFSAPIQLADGKPSTWAIEAASFGDIEMPEALYKIGVNLSPKIDLFNAPISFAMEKGQIEAVRTLIKLNDFSNSLIAENRNILHAAIKTGNLLMVREIIQNCNIDLEAPTIKENFTPVFIAARHGFTEILTELAKYHLNLNTPSNQGMTPLYIAAYFGHLETTLKLINLGANLEFPNVKGGTPISAAIQYGHKEIVSELINANAEVNLSLTSYGFTNIFIAVEYNRFEIAEILLASNKITELLPVIMYPEKWRTYISKHPNRKINKEAALINLEEFFKQESNNSISSNEPIPITPEKMAKILGFNKIANILSAYKNNLLVSSVKNESIICSGISLFNLYTPDPSSERHLLPKNGAKG